MARAKKGAAAAAAPCPGHPAYKPNPKHDHDKAVQLRAAALGITLGASTSDHGPHGVNAHGSMRDRTTFTVSTSRPRDPGLTVFLAPLPCGCWISGHGYNLPTTGTLCGPSIFADPAPSRDEAIERELDKLELQMALLSDQDSRPAHERELAERLFRAIERYRPSAPRQLDLFAS